MTNPNFRTSSMQELFGTHTIGAPPPPGQLDWQTIAITGAIVLVGVVITVSIIWQAQKTIIIHTTNLHDESISKITDELADQRVLIFKLANSFENEINEASKQDIKS